MARFTEAESQVLSPAAVVASVIEANCQVVGLVAFIAHETDATSQV